MSVNEAQTVSVTPTTLTLDVGQSHTFTASASGGTGTLSYQWYLDDSPVLGETGATYTYTPNSAGTPTIYCIITDSASAPNSIQSNTPTITVNAAQTVSTAPTSIKLDLGQSQTFTCTPSGGTGTLSYQWYLDGAPVLGETGATYTYIPSSAGTPTIYCIVTDTASTPYPVQSNTPSVTASASPTVSISPTGPLTMDVGQSQLFTAVPSGGSGAIHYQWYVGSTAVGSDSSTYTYTASGSSASVTCVISDSASVPVTSSASNAVSITVTPAPIVTVSPDSRTLDIGQSQVFTASASDGSGSYVSYQWFVNSVLQSETSASFTYSPSTAGSYSITCTVTDSLGATSAPSTAATVVVSASPTVSVSPTGPFTMDVGQSQLFTAVPSGGSGAIHYQWYVGSTAVGSDSSTYTYTASGSSASVTCVISDSASVPVTSSASNAVSITVNASPTVSVSPTGPFTMDVGQSQLFTAVPSGGSGAIHYQWYVGSTAVGSDSSTYTYTASGSSASVTCVISDSASVPVTSSASNAVSITVNASPTVSVSPSGSLTMDVGQTVQFTATPSGGSGSIHYQWFVGGSAVGSDSSTYTYTASGTSASITCVITDSASVPITSPASTTVTITVNPTLTVTVAPTSWTMEVGQSKTFTATASGGSGTLSYQWYLGNSPVSGQTGTSYTFTASSVGSPVIYATVTDQASAPSTAQSNTPSVTVNSAPTVTVSPGSYAIDVGQSATFTAVPSSGSGSYSSYQWYVDNVAQSGKTASTFTLTQGIGSYSITVTVTDSLGGTSVQSSAATLTVNAALSTPSTSASSSVINQGQSSTLSITGLSGGSTPYTYQWFEKLPGTSNYVAINGETSSTYSFATTTTSTTIGVWSFEVQVSDSAITKVTVTSASTTEIVNSGSIAWDFEDHTTNHIDLTTETPTEIQNIETAENTLYSQYGLPTPISIAYPDGLYSSAVESVISQYRLTARLAGDGTSPMVYPISNYYEMSSVSLDWNTNFAHIQNLIDAAIAQKGQLNLFTHLVSDNIGDLQTYGGCTPELLSQTLAYLKTQQNAGNLQVLTARQAYYAFNGQIAVVTISFNDAWATDYTTAYPMLQQYGFEGTSYVIGNIVGSQGCLTWGEIDAMAQISPPAWTLTVNSNPASGGGVTSVSGTFSVQQYEESVTATPASGYTFGGWVFDGSMSTVNPIVIGPQTAGTSHTLTAYFLPITSSTAFQDGFESGSFSNWWPSSSSSTIVTSPTGKRISHMRAELADPLIGPIVLAAPTAKVTSSFQVMLRSHSSCQLATNQFSSCT